MRACQSCRRQSEEQQTRPGRMGWKCYTHMAIFARPN